MAEAEISTNTLRGVAFHGPQIFDPDYTRKQLAFRDYYPDYYLHPNDEFVFQIRKGREVEQSAREEMHAEGVRFLKEWSRMESE